MAITQQNVPVLRFKDNQKIEYPDWERKKLSDFCDSITGFPLLGEEILEAKTSTPLLRGVNISEGFIRHSKEIDRYHGGLVKEEFLLKEGDVVIGMDGSKVGRNVATVTNLDEGSFLVQRITRLRPRNNNSIKYVYQNLVTNRFLNYVYEVNSSSGIPHISLKQIREYPIWMPCVSEQSKIATFLSSVDTKIEQLNRKKSLLEQYKKGLMQRLFSQEIRFKDQQGKEYPDWEERRLGEFASFSKGKGVSKNDVTSRGAVKCIRYGQLYTHYRETISNIVSSTNLPVHELVLSKKNDVIIPASGETAEDIATAACVLVAGAALGGDINIIRCQQNGIFLAYCLKHKKTNIARLAQGISVIHLYAAQLKLLKLGIPSLKEQQKIASFLSAIDKKIELVTESIKQAQTFKKGLLQQMFI